MSESYDIFENIPEDLGEIDSEIVPITVFDSEPYEIPEDFERISLDIDSENCDRIIRNTCDKITDKLNELGYSDSLYTGMYESILNAYQHGNDCDPSKDIIVAYDIHPRNFVMNVKDECDEIHSEFLDFYKELKEGNCSENFYKYADQERDEENQGCGLRLMDAYFDDVRYFRSKDNGLITHLFKEK